MNLDYAENRKCPKIINEYCWWVFSQLIISVKFYNDSLNLKNNVMICIFKRVFKKRRR